MLELLLWVGKLQGTVDAYARCCCYLEVSSYVHGLLIARAAAVALIAGSKITKSFVVMGVGLNATWGVVAVLVFFAWLLLSF